MTPAGGVWTLVRDKPAFTPLAFDQRSVRPFSDDRQVIRGACEQTKDTGELDFQVVYTKVLSPPRHGTPDQQEREERVMSKVRFEITMSLDGYVTAADPTLEEPMGTGGRILHQLAFRADDTGRQLAFSADDTGRRAVEESQASVGKHRRAAHL